MHSDKFSTLLGVAQIANLTDTLADTSLVRANLGAPNVAHVSRPHTGCAAACGGEEQAPNESLHASQLQQGQGAW